ncbi:MAG: hypothetical protein QM820_21720 [Minicystis sp.]
MSEAGRPNLAVLKDGAPLPDDEARALWIAFSAHMDEHRGDMAGFAKLKGWHSVLPEHRKGQAVLVVSTTPEAAAKAKAAAPPPKAAGQGKGGPPKGGKPQGGGQAKGKGAPQKKPQR